MKFKKLFIFIMVLVIASFVATGIFSSVRPSEAEFVVASLDISPAEAKVGETVTVTASVANRGGKENTYTATLTVNGEEAEGGKGEVKVPAGETRPVQFALTFHEAGTYEIAVDGMSATLVVSPAE
jgi:uncharacterized protein (DUF58 family)